MLSASRINQKLLTNFDENLGVVRLSKYGGKCSDFDYISTEHRTDSGRKKNKILFLLLQATNLTVKFQDCHIFILQDFFEVFQCIIFVYSQDLPVLYELHRYKSRERSGQIKAVKTQERS